MSKATCKCGVTVEDYKMVTIADKTFCIKCAMKYPTAHDETLRRKVGNEKRGHPRKGKGTYKFR